MANVGPLSNVQLAHIAREHYVNGKSRVEIADETGLSRFKVGRMLDEAVEKGIIRFEIVSTPGIDLDLSMRLKQRFALDHGVAVELPVDTDAEAQSTLGTVAASLVDELVGPDDILGLTSGRTLNVMARQLQELPAVRRCSWRAWRGRSRRAGSRSSGGSPASPACSRGRSTPRS